MALLSCVLFCKVGGVINDVSLLFKVVDISKDKKPTKT